MDQSHDIHIGELIRQAMKAQGRKNYWLAEQIYVQPSAISKIYKRKSIDTEQLRLISQALGVDLFQHYSSNFNNSQKSK